MMGYLDAILLIAAPLYIGAVLLYSLRAIRGPTISDIVLAIDSISYDLAVFLTLLSIYNRSPLMIAPSIMLALWAFLLDIFVSKYLISKEVGV